MSRLPTDSPRRVTMMALGAAALLLVLSMDRGAPVNAAARAGSAATHQHSGHMAMQLEMARLSEARYRAHPPHGRDVLVNGTPAATFDVADFIFDADGNTGTQVDTAHILVGEAVRWNWAEGTHTTTADGGQWDAPIDGQNTTFDHTFTAAGLYPFSCVFHAGFNM